MADKAFSETAQWQRIDGLISKSGIVLNPVNGASYEGMIAPYLDSRKLFLMPTLDFMLLNGDVGETPSQSARIMR
jgi:hypothetical protein